MLSASDLVHEFRISQEQFDSWIICISHYLNHTENRSAPFPSTWLCAGRTPCPCLLCSLTSFVLWIPQHPLSKHGSFCESTHWRIGFVFDLGPIIFCFGLFPWPLTSLSNWAPQICVINMSQVCLITDSTVECFQQGDCGYTVWRLFNDLSTKDRAINLLIPSEVLGSVYFREMSTDFICSSGNNWRNPSLWYSHAKSILQGSHRVCLN